MECFVIIVNGFQPLTIITKHSILDVVAALDPPMLYYITKLNNFLGHFQAGFQKGRGCKDQITFIVKAIESEF